MKRRVFLAIAVAAVIAAVVYMLLEHRAQDPSHLGARYVKQEFRIPMRDGVNLYTAVYVPKNSSQSFPFLLWRTPFGTIPYGKNAFPARLGPSQAFDRSGYIFVVQDVRGRFQSEGQFIDMPPQLDRPQSSQVDESTDAYDTIEWLLHHIEHNNGRVGIWGMSYPGFFASASIINSHPAIKAASVQAPATDLFRGDDAYHNGAFMLAAQFLLYSSFFRIRADGPDFPPQDLPLYSYGTENGYNFFLQHGPDLASLASLIHNPLFDTNVRHNTFDDYWQPRDVAVHLRGIHCSVLNVGGWFDAEDLAGTLRTYRAIERQNPGIENLLVMGPWEHGGWLRLPHSSGDVAADAADYYREYVVFPFFESRLKQNAETPLAKAQIFDTGSNRWRQFDAWPPREAQDAHIYLHANGSLSLQPPRPDEGEYDEYVSDPARPVPYVPVAPTSLAEGYTHSDQRFAASRPDVLTYSSEPLPQDVTLAGPVSPRLFVSSSGTDSDFDVKLIDVFPDGEQPADVPAGNNQKNMSVSGRSRVPDGYEELVRGEPMRAKLRNSLSDPEPLVPGAVTNVNFDLPDAYHTFRVGHRIMVQIQSSWFPLTDLNPQKFVDTAAAQKSDFVRATERVYHTLGSPSALAIKLLPQR